jgi:hypothetical protein
MARAYDGQRRNCSGLSVVAVLIAREEVFPVFHHRLNGRETVALAAIIEQPVADEYSGKASEWKAKVT